MILPPRATKQDLWSRYVDAARAVDDDLLDEGVVANGLEDMVSAVCRNDRAAEFLVEFAKGLPDQASFVESLLAHKDKRNQFELAVLATACAALNTGSLSVAKLVADVARDFSYLGSSATVVLSDLVNVTKKTNESFIEKFLFSYNQPVVHIMSALFGNRVADRNYALITLGEIAFYTQSPKAVAESARVGYTHACDHARLKYALKTLRLINDSTTYARTVEKAASFLSGTRLGLRQGPLLDAVVYAIGHEVRHYCDMHGGPTVDFIDALDNDNAVAVLKSFRSNPVQFRKLMRGLTKVANITRDEDCVSRLATEAASYGDRPQFFNALLPAVVYLEDECQSGNRDYAGELFQISSGMEAHQDLYLKLLRLVNTASDYEAENDSIDHLFKLASLYGNRPRVLEPILDDMQREIKVQDNGDAIQKIGQNQAQTLGYFYEVFVKGVGRGVRSLGMGIANIVLEALDCYDYITHREEREDGLSA